MAGGTPTVEAAHDIESEGWSMEELAQLCLLLLGVTAVARRGYLGMKAVHRKFLKVLGPSDFVDPKFGTRAEGMRRRRRRQQ
jgi:hypothetical protein